jgi:hypothetical protein
MDLNTVKNVRATVATWPTYRVSHGTMRTMQHRMWDRHWQMWLPDVDYASPAAVALISYLTKNAEGGEIECTRYRGHPPPQVAKAIEASETVKLRYPADGRLMGDWNSGEKTPSPATSARAWRATASCAARASRWSATPTARSTTRRRSLPART